MSVIVLSSPAPDVTEDVVHVEKSTKRYGSRRGVEKSDLHGPWHSVRTLSPWYHHAAGDPLRHGPGLNALVLDRRDLRT